MNNTKRSITILNTVNNNSDRKHVVNLVDVNVHPAKVEVKFLNERDLFDCIRYGVEGALEKASGRVEMKLPKQEQTTFAPKMPVSQPSAAVASPAKSTFFRTMSADTMLWQAMTAANSRRC